MHKLTLLFVALAACGKVVGDLPFDGPIGDTPDARMGSADARLIDARTISTVKELRMSPPPSGTRGTIRGLVVTFHETRGNTGTLVVQDMDGGMFSAITVLCNLDGTSCNLGRVEIDNLPIGRVVDVDGVYDEFVPVGTPTPAAQARILRPTITVTTMTRPVVPVVVQPGQVAFDQLGAPATAGLLWQFVKVNGPLTVTEAKPPRLQGLCGNPLDAGTPMSAFRGVIATVGGKEIGVGLRPSDFMYCVFQCELRCQQNAMNGDTLMFVQGVVDPFYRDTAPGGLLVVPGADADIPR